MLQDIRVGNVGGAMGQDVPGLSRTKLFVKYLLLFTLLFASLASLAMRALLQIESNPFFYSGF